jgi:hypothetical protein
MSMSVSFAAAGRLRDDGPERNTDHAVFCYPEEVIAARHPRRTGWICPLRRSPVRHN